MCIAPTVCLILAAAPLAASVASAQDPVTGVWKGLAQGDGPMVPTGGMPNSYGEVRTFRLPNAGLSISYSTKYFRMLEEDPPSVEPDVLVELGSEDHFRGQDPVLERALSIELGATDK